MSEDRWQRVDRLLQSALSRPRYEREAFVRAECQADDGVRDEVLSLLAHEASAEMFLEPPPPRAPLPPGARLGAYEIRAQIGEGGMGEVYRAHDDRLRRDIAIKILPPEAADAERRQRFAREAQVVAALNHPGIVTIHSVEQADGIHFLTMELVDGQSLDAVIPLGGLSIDQLLTLAIPLAEAVGAAHSQGIVHRDLKPSNVMVTRDRRVKVMDFGLAKLARRTTLFESDESPATGGAQLTGEGRIFGTVAYMSPEQAEGRDVDHRSDVFSLGVVLFELATGRRPFTGDSPVAVLASIVKDTPPALTALKPGLPGDFARLINRCLAKEPARRYQSVLDLRNNLEEIKEERQSPQVPLPQSWRRRWLLPVVAAVCGMISMGAILYFVPSIRHIFWPLPPDKSKFAITIFQNETGDPSLDRIGRQVSEQVTGALNSLGAVTATPIGDSSLSVDDVRRVVERAGIGRVVRGTYFLNGDDIRVVVDVRDVNGGGQTYPFLPIVGPRADTGGLVATVVSYLKGAVAGDKQTDWNGRQSRTRPMPYEAWLAVQDGDGAILLEKQIEHYLRARRLAPDAFVPMLLLHNRYFRAGRPHDVDGMVTEIGRIYSDQTPVSQTVFRLFRAQAEGRLEDELRESTDLAWFEQYEFTPLVMLSDAQTKMRYLSAAAENYRQAVDIPIGPGANPRRISARVNAITSLGDLHHELELFDEQLADARRGRQLHPNHAVFFADEAGALVGLGRPLPEIQTVIKQASASGTLVPSAEPRGTGQASMVSLLTLIARELKAHGRRDEGIELSRRAIEEVRNEMKGTGDGTPTQRADLLSALMGAEDWPAAYSAYAGVVETQPNDFIARGNLGVIAAALGNRAEAERMADVLLNFKLPFINGAQHYQRARVLAALGNADAAMVALKRSVSEGYGWKPGLIHRDTAFDPIREHGAFKEFCQPKELRASTSGGRN